MLDILTYALARKKAAAELADQIKEIETVAADAEKNAALSQELYEKTQDAAQQAAASASAVSYALGADIDGKLSFYEKVEEEES